jgi:hypothetical protein
MATTTVFVDDVVQGRLPTVCVRDGVPTGDQLKFAHPVGEASGLGVLWLLVLAGPPGWIALLALAGRDRGERLTVVLPYSEVAYGRLVEIRRLRVGGFVVAVGALVAGVLATNVMTPMPPIGPLPWVVPGAVAIGAVTALVVAEWRMRNERVGVEFDASRRWVTLRRVHPAFAAACDDAADAPSARSGR